MPLRNKRTFFLAGGVTAIIIAAVAVGFTGYADARQDCLEGDDRCVERRVGECRESIAAFNETQRHERAKWRKEHEAREGTPEWSRDYRAFTADARAERNAFLRGIRDGECSVMQKDDSSSSSSRRGITVKDPSPDHVSSASSLSSTAGGASSGGSL